MPRKTVVNLPRNQVVTFKRKRVVTLRGISNEQSDRKFTQLAADLLYRFGAREQFYAGARYNTLTGEQVFGQSTNPASAGGISQGVREDISVNRTAFAAGWFVTKNILVKGEYVIQKYNDFPTGNILEGGEFKGFVLQGVIAF